MLYGINYQNGFGGPRSCVCDAISKENAREKFYINNPSNGFEIISIDEITSSKCVLLYQSYRDIVGFEYRDSNIIKKSDKLSLTLNNILGHDSVTFKECDLHWNGDYVEVMVCVHDGTPNWLYYNH